MISKSVPLSSAAMFTAFVITVKCESRRNWRATAVVVVPESSRTHISSLTSDAAASAIRCFSFNCLCSFSCREGSNKCAGLRGKVHPMRTLS